MCKNRDWNSFWLIGPTLSSFSGSYFCLGYLLENPFTCLKTHYFFLIPSIHRLSSALFECLFCVHSCAWDVVTSESYRSSDGLLEVTVSNIHKSVCVSPGSVLRIKKDMKSPFLQYGTCNVPVPSYVSPAAVSDLRGLSLLNCLCVSVKPTCSFLSYNECVQSDIQVCYYSSQCELI